MIVRMCCSQASPAEFEGGKSRTFIADCMYAVCTCGGRLVALGCKRASTTKTCTGCPLQMDWMSSPVGPSIQYPESPGVLVVSAAEIFCAYFRQIN